MKKTSAMQMKVGTCLSIITLLVLVVVAQNSLQIENNKEMKKLVVTKKDEVIKILRDKELRQTNAEKVIVAIETAGKEKMVEAIPELIELLSFERKSIAESEQDEFIQEFRTVTPSLRYPAIGALFSIGKPAVPDLVEIIKCQEPNGLLSNNALTTVENIFREDLHEAVSLLEQKSVESSLPSEKERLILAATKISKLIAKPKSNN